MRRHLGTFVEKSADRLASRARNSREGTQALRYVLGTESRPEELTAILPGFSFAADELACIRTVRPTGGATGDSPLTMSDPVHQDSHEYVYLRPYKSRRAGRDGSATAARERAGLSEVGGTCR